MQLRSRMFVTLNTLLQSAIDTNAFQCEDCVRSGVTIPGHLIGSESYTAKIVYADGNAKRTSVKRRQRPAALQALMPQQQCCSQTMHLQL
jgi:hypothetical protein